MGRFILADQGGIEKGDEYVHKFWVAVQPSDVSDYLKSHKNGTNMLLADLNVDQEDSIKATVAELKAKFEKKYGTSYEHFMEDAITEHEMFHQAGKLASRINLGEHLLATIANMKAAGIHEQLLTIEY